MRRIWVAALWFLLSATVALAQSNIIGSGVRGDVKVSAGGYTGPGNISTYVAWVGLRAYTTAYATPGTNPAADVCDAATGLTCTTINIKTSGDFDWTTAAALPQCATSCQVTKLYDQTGNGHHLTATTVTSGPLLIFGSSGACTGISASKGCMSHNGSTQWLESAANITQAQPITYTMVGKRATGATGSFNALFGGTATCSPGTFWDNVSGMFSLFAGSEVSNTSVTENAWHSIVAVINNASSVLNVDNVENSGTAGTAALSSSALALGACSGGNSFLTGSTEEGGMIASAPAGGTRTSLEANAKTYWGF